MFHLTTWLSMNSVVYALPRPSKVVCSGPRPSSTSAAMVSRGSFSLPANRSGSLAISIIDTVGDSLPLAMKYLPSDEVLQPCGFFGTGM